MSKPQCCVGLPLEQAEQLLRAQGYTVNVQFTGKKDTGIEKVIRQVTSYSEVLLTVACFKPSNITGE